MTAFSRGFLSLCLIATLAGCSSLVTNEPELPPPSTEEIQAFANMLEQRFNEFPNDAMRNQWDFDFFMDQVYETGLGRSIGVTMARSEIENSLVVDLGSQIGSDIMMGGSYKLMKVYTDSLGGHALFRMIGRNGMNYHDFRLVNTKEGVKIGDIFIYTTGEFYSATTARLMSMALAENTFLKGLGLSDEKTEELFAKIESAYADMDRGDYASANQTLEEIRPTMLQEKFWHVIRVQVTSMLTDTHYLLAMEEFHDQFGDNDPAWLLTSLDYFLLTQEYDRMIETLQNLKNKVGPDAYLDLMEYSVRIEKNEDPASIIPGLKDVLVAEPDLTDAYYLMMYCQGEAGDYEGMANTMTVAYDSAELSISTFDLSLYPKFFEAKNAAATAEHQGFTLEELKAMN